VIPDVDRILSSRTAACRIGQWSNRKNRKNRKNRENRVSPPLHSPLEQVLAHVSELLLLQHPLSQGLGLLAQGEPLLRRALLLLLSGQEGGILGRG
jgi:hypothetical protein